MMMGGSTTRKYVEQFPGINKLFDVAACWIYIGIQLGAHHILHISRISVNRDLVFSMYYGVAKTAVNVR
jgi:hypothetical protein